MNLKHIFIAFVLIVIIGAGILIWKVKHIPDELVVVNVEPIPVTVRIEAIMGT